MKRNILILPFFMALLCGCLSEGNVWILEKVSGEQEEKDSVVTYKLIVDATKGGVEPEGSSQISTRALSLDGKTLNASWATTEHVYVKDGSKWIGTLSPDANAASAQLNGTISVTGELPQSFKFQFPRQEFSYSGQVGTLEDIAAKYDYATATANVSAVEGENLIVAEGPVRFENQQAIVRFILKDKNEEGNPLIETSALRISATDLKITESTYGDVSITPASASSDIFAALRDINGQQVTLTATVGDETFVYKKDNVTFANGQYYQITVKMSKLTYPVALSEVTGNYIGSVVGADGNVYPDVAAATAVSTAAVAMVAYVSDTGHGLAIALADDVENNQEDAIAAASGHAAVTGGTWRLPTVADWKNMINGCGNVSISDNMNYTCLNSKLAIVGTALESNRYWSSIEYRCPYFDGANVDLTETDVMDGLSEYKVRACLAF